jgi:predicted exporter
VVVQGPDVQTTLQRAEAAAERWKPGRQGLLGGFDSVTRFVPSLATQQQRLAALPDAPTLQRGAAAGHAGRAAAGRAPGAFGRRRTPGSAAGHAAGPAGSAVAPLVDALMLRRPDGSGPHCCPCSRRATRHRHRRRAAGLPGLPDTQLLDIGTELGLYQRYLREAQTQALLGALGVVLLMALWLRSGRRLLAVCQPLVLAVLLTMGVLAALGVQLGILHLVGLLLVVAVGSNYALFFDLLQQQGGHAGRRHAGVAAAGQHDHRDLVSCCWRSSQHPGACRPSAAWWRRARCWRCCWRRCSPPRRAAAL